MKSSLARSGSLILGIASIAAGLFSWAWIFYAWDAAQHMGSPLRRHSEQVVSSLTGEKAYIAKDSHGAGLVLIDVLGNTFWVLFASGAFMIVLGGFLVLLSRLASASSPGNSFEPGPLRGSS
jgi:hypothetical protein